MRLGLSVGYWGLGLTAEQQIALVREAEAVGYDSVWAAEAYGSDAATVLAWIAAQTENIRIGSAIFQMPGRSPAMTAMTAAVTTGDASDVDGTSERIASMSPLGYAGFPEDIAAAALFLASDDARYTTGSVVGADGGQAVGYFLSVPGRRFSGGRMD